MTSVAQGLGWGGLGSTVVVLGVGKWALSATADDTEIALENKGKGKDGDAISRSAAHVAVDLAF